jgi:hypothetical protein
MISPHARRLAAAAALALAIGGLAACGGDDDDTAGEATEDEAGGGLEADPAGGELAAYCSAELTLEAASASADFEGDPAGAAGSLLETAQASRDLAPEEVAPLLDEGIAVLQGVADGGDPAAMESFDFTPVHTYDLENCGWESSEVTAKDFAFEGLPAEIPAGPHSFEITNSGAELHVMVILAKAEGVTESWDEIMAADEESGLYEEMGAGFAPPGADGYVVVDLPAGDYMALCPIPTGTTMAAEGSGPPHFVHGMTQEFSAT